jgi:hypothetical protein
MKFKNSDEFSQWLKAEVQKYFDEPLGPFMISELCDMLSILRAAEPQDPAKPSG